MRRPARLLAALLCVGALAGCGSAAGSSSDPQRTWAQQNDGPPPNVDPHLPGQPDSSQGAPVPQPADPSARSGSRGSPNDPNVIADHLQVPWGLAILPDGSALVGERPTGRVLQVKPQRAPVHEVDRITGIDPTGDGGLLGLALSPSYDEDGLVFAYISTRTDNRVVRFSLGQPPMPILTGIPHGSYDNGGRIGFGPDGDLYVGTGDAGHPALAASPTSLAGKILRITVFGRPATGNRDPRSPVYARGFRDVAGLCWDDRKQLFATDSGARTDELNAVASGADFGWPHAEGESSVGTAPLDMFPRATLTPGGCATINYGLFVTGLRGQDLLAIPINLHGKPGGAPQALLKHSYGRLRTVVAAPDGALWITTSNRDGAGEPVPIDDRVLRIQPPSSTTNSPV